MIRKGSTGSPLSTKKQESTIDKSPLCGTFNTNACNISETGKRRSVEKAYCGIYPGYNFDLAAILRGQAAFSEREF